MIAGPEWGADLSVAMATFNGEAYLRAQLDSIAAQTVLPGEIVICDDRSADRTAQVVADFARTAPFAVRFDVNEERIGYRRNFIQAATRCSGGLISFCDQDDIWMPTKVADTLDHLARHGDLLVAHDFSVFFDGADRPEIPSYFAYLAESGLSRAVSIKGCAFTIRRALIERAGWPPRAFQDRWGHDNWVCVAAHLLDGAGFLDKPLIRHRIHGANTSGGLWGGRDRLRRMLRGLHCPPLTSRRPLDAFLSYYFHDDGRDVYLAAIGQCAPAMSEQQRRRALRAYDNRIAYLDFPASPAYRTVGRRAARALGLFLRGVYRDGDGLLGLLQDLDGDRSGRI
ncbi:MAG TPA: glycosyltransferase [Falsiroseomonas sp.]|nr:glycosyltransferase [Falsiroseomonas sp.]